MAPLFGFLSHWNTRHYSPLLVVIKIIMVKFFLKITTSKIQSDCFGIKRSRKRPTDCSLQLALHMHSHTWRWNVIKDAKFHSSLVRWKSLQNVGTSGYFLAYTIFRTSFCWREVHIWKTLTYNPKIVNIHYLVGGHWTLCDATTKWNNENKCFYMETAILSHCKSEKPWQITK